MGRFLAIVLIASAVLAGGGMYYLQVYGYYRTLDPASPEAMLTVVTDAGPVPLAVGAFEGIDSDSSPIRFRACARLAGDLPADARAHPAAVPLTAPGWFACFDAAEIGGALERGEARAFFAAEHSPWGVDRVLAAFPDGRIFVWPQINPCGAELFDGKPLPEGCPPPPARPEPSTGY
ncbi:MAG: histidine kinase [Paracoccaceae bacterium]|nr:MAG: histidine kinase [Paracoccaceae bacterium]